MAQSRKRTEYDLTPVEQVANALSLALNAGARALHRFANFVEDHSGPQCVHYRRHPAGKKITRIACGLCWDERQNEKRARERERAEA